MSFNSPVNSTCLRILSLGVLLLATQPASAQIGGLPGAAFRLGFGARGIAMGNAMSAVDEGEISGYYNPALLPFTERSGGSIATGILTLDRSLNFLSFSAALPPQAGLGAGILNSGVSNIDGRDIDGQPTGPMKTAENMAYLGFGIRFPAGFSLGINLKLLYAHLYTDITSSTIGVDLGFLYRVSDRLRIAGTVRDISSKYKWDTSSLYGQEGKSSVDRFPRLYTLGAALVIPEAPGVVSIEFETSDQNTMYMRAGAEYSVIRELALRAGVDRIDLKQKGNGVRPAVGFVLQKDFASWTPAIQYTYVFEPFTDSGIHFVSISALF